MKNRNREPKNEIKVYLFVPDNADVACRKME